MSIIWISVGLILLATEYFTKNKYALCVAASAFINAIIFSLYPISIINQSIIFITLSIATTVVLKINKPKKTTYIHVQQNIAIGNKGIITKNLTKYNLGQITFEKPIMGCKEWIATSDFAIPLGDEAVVVDIHGNYLKVEPTVWSSKNIS